MNPENIDGGLQPKTPEEVEKEQEYEKGKLIQFPDGTTKMVHNREEEMTAWEDWREGQK